MHFFSQLKINGLLLEVQGYFQSKMNVLEIHCKEVISLFKNWKYEEVVVVEFALIDKDQTVYLDNSNLVISEVSHNQIKLLHI
ncbi:hypothetical protein H9635_03310 [Solibacillus sp. A46]|mgnify:FL=1|uniref:Uncharacterized protein n=1 Tax=Solibacillus faecavium TaxID=2762221 RepID=A0ABR8XUZ7_9BACL|nr:hypothetical protein [Solibacillus faecavium]MBD8035755.1 hypothetical protein [Solibacillus faecavium]